MMNGHPGGADHTLRMIRLGNLPEGSRVLDMGAGDGTTLRLLQDMGYEAEGIDREPRGVGVCQGDFCRTEYPAEYFDGIFSQCAFWCSGEREAALREAWRILKPGGVLLWSDVFFEDAQIEPLCADAGFRMERWEDLTALWKEYYIEAIWRGDAVCISGSGKCRYLLLVCRKEGTYGFI